MGQNTSREQFRGRSYPFSGLCGNRSRRQLAHTWQQNRKQSLVAGTGAAPVLQLHPAALCWPSRPGVQRSRDLSDTTRWGPTEHVSLWTSQIQCFFLFKGDFTCLKKGKGNLRDFYQMDTERERKRILSFRRRNASLKDSDILFLKDLGCVLTQAPWFIALLSDKCLQGCPWKSHLLLASFLQQDLEMFCQNSLQQAVLIPPI